MIVIYSQSFTAALMLSLYFAIHDVIEQRYSANYVIELTKWLFYRKQLVNIVIKPKTVNCL